ncbi:MAG: hypothetical protein DLM65_12075 [Candidatus Aeolococcus gillhamiae]|uniref:Sce7726 family protein n=1 Tax=Candidatus Aeolococcus gillhamiae TaxID=3127015 RepID=A0A2W5Z0X6_9BACT|nr:MAG: hypothetical protein DLM65_12075 [Candidatus Dormibacter sp. RRmetagenome_bin12]
MTTEAVVRGAPRQKLLAAPKQAPNLFDEFWVPRSNERADIALVSREMNGYEIKTDRDTLRRLPRQAPAYGRVFDRCTAVVASRHSSAVIDMLPEWWGIVEISVNGTVGFTVTRGARANPEVDPETLVRLLWRDEAFIALVRLGAEPSPRSTRSTLWTELLRLADLAQLRAAVRRALRHRASNPSPSRFMPLLTDGRAGR